MEEAKKRFFLEQSLKAFTSPSKDLEMTGHLSKFAIFKEQEDIAFTKSQANKSIKENQRKSKRHNDFVAHLHSIKAQHHMKDEALNRNWSKTILDEKNLKIKDVCYELTVQKVKTLRKLRDAESAREDEIDGIESFEDNMRKRTIDIGEGKLPAIKKHEYEDTRLFFQRLELQSANFFARSKDYKSLLARIKARVSEKKQATEKRQGKRGTFLSTNDGMSIQEMVGGVADVDGDIFDAKAASRASSDSDTDDDTAVDTDAVRTAIDSREKAAEEHLRIFFEQYRANTDESKRASDLAALVADQADRKEKKLSAYADMCSNIVSDIIFDVMEKVDGEVGNAYQAKPTRPGPTMLPEAIARLTEQLAFGKEVPTTGTAASSTNSICTEELMKLDAWMPFATLASNLGRWRVAEEEAHAVVRKEGILESYQKLTGDLINKFFGRGIDEDLNPLTSVEIESLFSLNYKDAKTYFVYVLPSCISVGANNTRPSETFRKACSWFGSCDGKASSLFSRAITWDFDDAISVGRKVTILLKGSSIGSSTGEAGGGGSKQKAVTKASAQAGVAAISSVTLWEIVNIFFGDSFVSYSGQEELLSVLISLQAMRVLNDIMECSSHVEAALFAVENAAGDAAVYNLTIACLVGQSLWLRSYAFENLSKLRSELAAGLKAIEVPPASLDKLLFIPSRQLVFVSFSCFRPKGAFISGSLSHLKIIDWFLRGVDFSTIRDESFLPDEQLDSLLLQLLQPDAAKGGAPGNKVKAKKAKPVATSSDLNISKHSVLKSIYHLKYGCDIVQEAASSEPIEAPLSSLAPFSATPQSESYESLLSNLTSFCVESAVPMYYFEEVGSSSTAVAALSSAAEELISPPIIPFSTNLQVVEIVVAAIIDSFATTALRAVDEEDDGAYQKASSSPMSFNAALLMEFKERALSCRDARRAKLSLSDRVWLQHLTGEKPLEPIALLKAYDALSLSLCRESENFTVILMSISAMLNDAESYLRQQEAAVIKHLKQIDERRWIDACSQTREKIAALIDGGSLDLDDSSLECEIDAILRDLVCRCGDVVDARHVSWLAAAEQVNGAVRERLTNTTSLFLRLMRSCLEIFKSALKNGEYIQSLIDAVFIGGPDPGNWIVPLLNAESASAKDMLRRLQQQLTDLLEMYGRDALNGSNEFWASVQIADDDVDQRLPLPLLGQYISAVGSVVISTSAYFSATTERFVAFDKWSAKSIYLRHTYEHKMLSTWSAQLLSIVQRPAQWSFLSSGAFTVSGDYEQDKIPWVMGGPGCVELGDLSLPLDAVVLLSEELGDISDADDLAERMLRAVKRISTNITYCTYFLRAWHDYQRIQSFVNAVCGNVTHLSVTRRRVYVLIALALGTLPAPPTRSYLLRLGAVLKQAAATSARFKIDVSALMTRVMADVTLAAGWWSEAKTESVKGYLSMIAKCFVNAEGLVDTEDFVYSLAIGPVTLEQWQQNLLVVGVNATTSASDHIPRFYQEGVYKWMSLSSKVFNTEEALRFSFSPRGAAFIGSEHTKVISYSFKGAKILAELRMWDFTLSRGQYEHAVSRSWHAMPPPFDWSSQEQHPAPVRLACLTDSSFELDSNSDVNINSTILMSSSLCDRRQQTVAAGEATAARQLPSMLSASSCVTTIAGAGFGLPLVDLPSLIPQLFTGSIFSIKSKI